MTSPYRAIIESPRTWDLLRDVSARFGLDTLVETGGYHGGTMAYLSPHFRRLVTVELGASLFDDIYALGLDNVLCLRGDSGRVLAQFLLFFDGPALFWLDAHPSGGDTAGTVVEVEDRFVAGSVVGDELMAVLDRGNPLDVVLVDDVGNYGIERDYLAAIVGGYEGWEIRYSGAWPNCIGMVTYRGRIGKDA